MTYQAAKWIKIPMLINAEELQDLFQQFEKFHLFSLGRLVAREQFTFSKEIFLKEVDYWVSLLKKGSVPSRKELERVLAAALSYDEETMEMQQIGQDRVIAKIKHPVIQLQTHYFSYSMEEQKFYSGIFGPESVFWGVQWSYPQVFFDPEEQEILKVDQRFSNTHLFRILQKWVRNATRPVTFEMQGRLKKTVPIRLGKECFSWIHAHPQLKQGVLQVVDHE